MVCLPPEPKDTKSKFRNQVASIQYTTICTSLRNWGPQTPPLLNFNTLPLTLPNTLMFQSLHEAQKRPNTGTEDTVATPAPQTEVHPIWNMEKQASFSFYPKWRSLLIPALIKSIYLHTAVTVFLQDFLCVVVCVEGIHENQRDIGVVGFV